MKITPAIIIDTLFTAFISFVLTLITLNYFIKGAPAIVLSITFSLIISLSIFKCLLTNRTKEKLSKAEKTAKTNMTNQLNLYSQTQQTNLIERAINSKGCKTERKKGGVFIKEQNIVIFSKFSFDEISKTDIVKAFNNAGREDLIYIFCDAFSPEIKTFADRFDGRIILVGSDKVFRFLTQTDCMPKEKFAFPEGKKLTFCSFKNVFRKEQSKRLAFFGLTLLLTSYFVPIKAYYIIFGGIFLFLSLICRLYGTSTPKNA
ncbi:MAG: hypothetical protein IKB67_05940 [Clostridia bacterium]|nr:hypothetical protein [Clostridia bacterium]